MSGPISVSGAGWAHLCFETPQVNFIAARAENQHLARSKTPAVTLGRLCFERFFRGRTWALSGQGLQGAKEGIFFQAASRAWHGGSEGGVFCQGIQAASSPSRVTAFHSAQEWGLGLGAVASGFRCDPAVLD